MIGGYFSGALDCLGLGRASLMKTLPKALQMAERAASSASSGQNDLFGLGSTQPKLEERIQPDLAPDWSLRERLQHEIEALGFYLSGHPIEASKELIDAVCSGRMGELVANLPPPAPPGPDGKTKWQPRAKHLFAAWVTDIRFFKGDPGKGGKGGGASYKLTLDDTVMTLSTWIDAEKWPKVAHFVKLDTLVFVLAELGMSMAREGRPAEPRLFNPEFFAPTTVMNDYAQRITLVWSRPVPEVAALKSLLTPYMVPLGVPVTVEFTGKAGSAVLELPPEWRLRADDACLTSLQQFLTADCVKVQYRRYQPPVQERRLERNSFASRGGDDE